MATGYDYTSLNERKQQIRLLCIRHAEVAAGRPLKCSLKIVSLPGKWRSAKPKKGPKQRYSLRSNLVYKISAIAEPAPEYYAISYAWGDAFQCASIIIDDKEVNVPASSEIALRYMSQHCRGRAKAYFWIDAICINQSDPDERSSQVAFMRDVYSCAQEVLLWMGPGDDRIAKPAIESLRTFLQELYQVYEDPSAVSKYDPEHESVFEDAAVKCCSRHLMDSLFSSTVFTRLWIIQELVLARSAICYCGQQRVSWYELGLAAKCLPGAYSGPVGSFNVELMWTRSFVENDRIDLGTLSDFQVSDPKDRVYALLGLMPDLAKAPDYTRSLKSIYAQAAVAIIEYDCSPYRIFKAAETYVPCDESDVEADDAGCPSWVPRFDGTRNVDMGSPESLIVGRASGVLSQAFSHSSTDFPDTLHLDGIRVDVINEVSTPVPWQRPPAEVSRSLVEAWNITGRAVSRRLPVEFSVQRAFATTLMSGSYRQDVLDQSRDSQYADFVLYVTWLNETYALPIEQMLEGLPSQDPRQSMEFQALSHEEYSDYVDNLSTRLFRANRLLISTRSGYIGLGSPKLQIGDHVCIVFGCKNPVILRPMTTECKRWTFVGTAYVYDVQEGQLIEELQASGTLEARTETFSIV